jgi:preprotein translocase subunit Sec63
LDTSTLKPTLDVSQSASSDNKLKIEIARVAQKFQQVVNGDYFQILGLRKNASSYEVQEAYERLSREFARSRFMAVKDNSLHDHLDEIARALAEAAEVLGEDAIREQYARNLVEPV